MTGLGDYETLWLSGKKFQWPIFSSVFSVVPRQESHATSMWRFPKIGVPPNHKELVRFSIINQPFLGYPHLWKAPCGVSKFFRNHQQSFSVLVESVESGTALRHRRFATLYRDGLGGRSWDSILLGWEAIKPPKTESNNRRMETRASKNSGGKVPKFIYWNVVRRSHFVSFSLLFFPGGTMGSLWFH